MLARSLTNLAIRGGTYVLRFNRFGKHIRRNYTSGDEHGEEDKEPQRKTTLLPGGGLEKCQGGIKEETYFNTHDMELMSKIRDAHGAKLKCENCLDNWSEFQRMLDNNTPAQIRETSSLNQQKNCTEEAFFLNERKDCLQLMQEKLNLNNNNNNDTSLKTQPKQMQMELEQSESVHSTELSEDFITKPKQNDIVPIMDEDEDREYMEYEPRISSQQEEVQSKNKISNSSDLPISSTKRDEQNSNMK